MNFLPYIKVWVKNNRDLLGFVLVLAAVCWVYSPSLYHFPRADHLGYLEKVSLREDWYSLAIKSFALNRETIGDSPSGDEQCFRPGLYFLLGNEKFFFGRNFFLWQAFGLLLHLLVVATLYRFLSRIKAGFLAVAWTAFFALMLGSSEAVIWHHINAYVLFALLVLWALERLYVFSVKKNRHDCLWIAAFLMALASFTFEAGSLYAFCMFIYLFLVSSEPKTKRLSFIFLLIPVSYFFLSALHFWISGCHSIEMLSGGTAKPSLIRVVPEFFFVMKWQLSSLFFVAHDVYIPGRMATAPQVLTWGWPFNDWGWERIFGSCALLSAALLFVVSRKYEMASRRPFLILLGALIVVYAVSLTVGRVSPRGLMHGLINTLYYLYNFWLLMAVSLYMLCCSFNGAVKGWRRDWLIAAGSLLFVFAAYQATAIYKNNKDFADSVKYYRMEDNNNQGMVSYKKGDFDQAVVFYTKAIEINHEVAELYYNRGITYYAQGDLDKALADFNSTIRINPHMPTVYAYRALVHFYKKNYEDCWKDVKRAQGYGHVFPPVFLDELKKFSLRAD